MTLTQPNLLGFDLMSRAIDCAALICHHTNLGAVPLTLTIVESVEQPSPRNATELNSAAQ